MYRYDTVDDDDHVGSIDHIQEELNRTERQLQHYSTPQTDNAAGPSVLHPDVSKTESVTNRLYQLSNEIDDLNIIYELSTSTDYISQTSKSEAETVHDVLTLLLHDLQRLETLSKFLVSKKQQQQQQQQDVAQPQPPASNRMLHTIYEQEYIPLYQYLHNHFILLLRKQLLRLNYPTITSAAVDHAGIGGTKDDDENAKIFALDCIVQICQSFHHLTRNIHARMLSTFRDYSSSHSNHTVIDPLIIEFCRPIVERIRYHFIIGTSTLDSADHHTNATTISYNTKIERLPELLFGYIREHVFDGDQSPWEIVCHIHNVLSTNATTTTTTTTWALDFLNEMLRTIQYVFSQRDFFRHPSIVSGPTTIACKPIYLMKAIEQILQFDSYIQTDVLYSLMQDSSKSEVDDSNKNSHTKTIRLMDVCVVGDDELLRWWLDRERESILSTLFDEDIGATDLLHHNKMNQRLHRTSARAELFCSLFRSIQIKANIFTFTGPYYSTVAVPMCIEFLDAVHETITDMKQKLLSTGNKTKSKLPTNMQLTGMIDQWIEVINGTYMAATMLTNTTTADSSTSETNVVNDDMVRFGRSLQHLHAVIIDDLITTIVETIVMERCKFAAYLMRCSHLLSQQQNQAIGNDGCIMSHDISETYRIISIIFDRCWIMKDNSADNTIAASSQMYLGINNYAPQMIRERLLSSMAEKLLEVALDIHGMTPDLNQYGCSVFANDAVILLSHHKDRNDSSSIVVPEYVLRVLDIVKIMQIDSATLRGIGNALCGLSGQSAPLTEDVFALDDRIYDEAICMIRAKGFVYIELSDVINILNRRRDL